ncbi:MULTISPECIES: hypothetical protein [unclassified Haloarcula]|jgi:RPA family protein|uniref:hypothetical protein n=1 Tax=Haloarcula sp. K1 TaxID=1622207 RepID=UPI0007BC5D27|nr:hypothetical protein [Haloarcula sp. K1]KZX46251.1 hypothetical protein AV929_15885 [Haloarcula sp. K1]
MSQTNYQTRNPARRTFAWEYKDATHEERKGDGDRAPRYLLLPTGEWANRVFIVGTLAEIVDSPENDQYIHGEVNDPTGRFHIDAGQYQPDAIAKMRRIETPDMVAITGKTGKFEGDSGVNTKIRVTNITPIPEALYDHWVADTAAKTMNRLERFGNEDNEAAKKAAEVYGTDLGKYRDAAIDALDRVQELIEEDQGQSKSSVETATN